MFVVDLGALRTGEVRFRRRIEPDDPLLEGVSDAFRAPVEMEIEARRAGDSVWVSVEVETTLALVCRRCVAGIRRPVDHQFDLVYASEADEADGEVYPIDPQAAGIDLAPALREHLLLLAPPYVTCRDDCRGLCPQCGIDLNSGDCDCKPESGTGPWDALKDVRFD